MTQEILAEVRASSARRVLAYGLLAALGGLLIYLGFSSAPAFIWRVFLIGAGIAGLLLAESLRRATHLSVVLTAQGLSDSAGREIAPLEAIVSVDRGAFAFKPSNGFVLRLSRGVPRRWAPGLYWAAGRRVGVGGVTPAGQGRFMAERIAMLIAERDA